MALPWRKTWVLCPAVVVVAELQLFPTPRLAPEVVRIAAIPQGSLLGLTLFTRAFSVVRQTCRA
jgi:hypothetical protein